MAVDPGEKRIGIALSDPSLTFARALTVLRHVSLLEDCAKIGQFAKENEVSRIVVGAPFDENEEARPQVRHAEKLADALRVQTSLTVELWDEYGSTQAARAARISMGVSRKKRAGHLDDVAAVILLQNYLDWWSQHAPNSSR
jgi:putative Holliday junction resolvase